MLTLSPHFLNSGFPWNWKRRYCELDGAGTLRYYTDGKGAGKRTMKGAVKVPGGTIISEFEKSPFMWGFDKVGPSPRPYDRVASFCVLLASGIGCVRLPTFPPDLVSSPIRPVPAPLEQGSQKKEEKEEKEKASGPSVAYTSPRAIDQKLHGSMREQTMGQSLKLKQPTLQRLLPCIAPRMFTRLHVCRHPLHPRSRPTRRHPSSRRTGSRWSTRPIGRCSASPTAPESSPGGK